MKMRKLYKFVSLLALGNTPSIVTKTIEAKSITRLHELLAKYDNAVLLLYKDDKQLRKNPKLQYKIYDLPIMFRATSLNSRYKEANVNFIRMNMTRIVCDLPPEWNVTCFPTFLLFEKGEIVKDFCSPALLQGFVSRKKLDEFINQHLAHAIQKSIKEKSQARQWRLDEAIVKSYERPACYYFTYPGAYYPYWHGYYYGRGFGCGFFWNR